MTAKGKGYCLVNLPFYNKIESKKLKPYSFTHILAN